MENEIKIKDWLYELQDGSYKVITKEGTFVLKDIEYDKLTRAKKRGESSNNIDVCILSEMIINKDGKDIKIGELELQTFKTSTIMKLLQVLNLIMGAGDFLEEFKPN